MAMGDLTGLMKQAKQLQERMGQLQEDVSAMEIEGSAGGGLVTVVMTGKSEMKRLKIDPSLMKPEEAEIVEDLFLILARISSAFIFLVCSGDYLSAGETANRYHLDAPLVLSFMVIKITGMISGISYEHHVHVAFWLLSDVSHSQEDCGHILDRHPSSGDHYAT